MLGAVFGIALLSAGTARAATAEGTLITNVASATFRATDFTPFAATYNASASVLVVAPSVQISKRATPSIECSGGTVTFCINISNASAWTSAFNITLRDRMPDGMIYIPGQTLWPSASITQGWGAEGLFAPFVWIWGSEPAYGSTSSANYYYLRWVINLLGPGRSALICYRVQLL